MRLPQRLLAFFLSFALIFSSTSALATTSVGGWTATDSLIAGANTTINATKTAGGKVLKSAVAVAPSVVKVGKHLIKGGGAAALLFAVPQILGDGVDWILDPANNAIKYTVPIDSVPTTKYLWASGGVNFATANLACADQLKLFKDSFSSYSNSTVTTTIIGERSANCVIHKYTNSGSYDGDNTYQIGAVVNPAYNPEAPTTEEKYLPIADVAAQVISNAEAGHAPSQEAVKATALEGFAAGEHDAALDAAATETGTENPPDTENPPKDPEAPAEPFDPSSIIAAINSLKALLAGILSSITSLSDWFKADPEQKDNEVDIPDVPLPEPNTDISFGGSCPADLSVNFNLYGTSTDFVLMPFSKFCPLLSTFVKPTLIVLGSFFAVSIVGGRRDE